MCTSKQNKKRKRIGVDENDGSGEFERRNSFNSYEDINDNDGANESMAEVEGGWSPNGLDDELLPPLPEIEVDTIQQLNVDKE